MARRIGIDLGGTKVEAVALLPDGREVFRKRIAAPRGDYQQTLDALAGLIRDAGEGTVGIGIPGSISRKTGLMKGSNSTWLIGKPIKRDLEQRLGREVRMENDANCFALSEATDGAGRGADVVFGVILGTGVGGGIVVGGRVLVGPNGIAGEWGHNPLPLPGANDLPLRPCYCGRAACVETYLSGPALAAEAAALGEDEAMSRYHERLARALATVINVVDPEVVVLGGGVSNVDSLYREVPRLWERYVFSDRVATRLERHVHGDASGVRGAAWLWNEPS
jgi:fructokinase